MKINIFRKCAATVIAVSMLSMNLTAAAAEPAPVLPKDPSDSAAQTSLPAPDGEQVPCDQYLSALLDYYYRSDPQAFVTLGLGTAEEAAAFFNDLSDTDYSAILEAELGIELPEPIGNELQNLMTQLMASTRYAVTGYELQPDGTCEVTVIYEQLIIFRPLMELYTAVVTDLVQTWLAGYDSIPDDEDLMIQLTAAYSSSLRVCLENATYAEPAITTVTLEPYGGIYLPDPDDFDGLESLLFDVDSFLENLDDSFNFY